MHVDIKVFEREVIVAFKKKDITTIDELVSIGCAMANNFCFEAGSLVSPEFHKFIEETKFRTTYAIAVGLDAYDRPFVEWGILDTK